MTNVKDILCTDSLALTIMSNSSVLVGLGNRAILHTIEESIQLPYTTRNRKVQGFAVNPRKLIIYAGNEYALLSYDNSKFKLLYVGETKDWINAATFTGDTTFVLHMAHSTMLHVQYKDDNHVDGVGDGDVGCQILEVARCTDYSMLYHTHLHGSNYNELLVMSGNGFGELLIWQPKNAEDSPPNSPTTKLYPLLMRVEAHNGVIFSIDYNAESRLLVSTSDDRSVKYWHVDFDPNDKAKDNDDWAKANIRPILSCFGHGARVMCATIIEYDGEWYVASGGEDSYICIWSSNGNLVLKRRQQFGAPIWRLAFDKTTSTLYSVGSTGNLIAYNLHQLFDCKQQLIALPALPSTAPMDLELEMEFVAKVKFLGLIGIIGISNRNNLFYMSLDSTLQQQRQQQQQQWRKIEEFPSYKCSVLEEKNGIVALCGYKRITLIKFNLENSGKSGKSELLFDGERLNSVIRTFHFLTTELYLVADKLGNCQILHGPELELISQIPLPSCREPWPTASLLLTMDSLLLSCRNGNVLFYTHCTQDHEDNEDNRKNYVLKSKLRHVHGPMGSTLLQLQSLGNEDAFIVSAGHESAIKLLHLNRTKQILSVSNRQCVPLAWVEAIISTTKAKTQTKTKTTARNAKTNANNDNILIGFNENHIVAWSHDDDILMQLDCGGGHRCWDYQFNNEDDNNSDKYLNIVFVKMRQLFLYHQPMQIHNTLTNSSICHRFPSRNHWHTRNCNTMELLPDTTSTLIASAGDDNLIKISKITTNSKLQQCAEIFTHISSVRHLSVYKLSRKTKTQQKKKKNIMDKTESWLIFSVGGRAQLCINRIDKLVIDNGDSTSDDDDEDDEYRAIEISTHTLTQQQNNDDADDDDCIKTEARLMAVDILNISNDRDDEDGVGEIFSIFVASADGKLRLHNWKLEKPQELNLIQLIDLQRCPLQMRCLNANYLLVATTNGDLFIYNTILTKCLLQLHLHDAGVNALDALIDNDDDDNILHLLTGGDDENVRYTIINLNTMRMQDTHVYSQLHHAQVNALKLQKQQSTSTSSSSSSSSACMRAFTCGIDKQFNCIDLMKQQHHRIGYTCISDIKGMLLDNNKNEVYFYGCGLEMKQL